MITRTHLDEAAALIDCLYHEAAYEYGYGLTPRLDRLLDCAERASKRYERRLDRYRPLRNVRCLLWHSLIGPMLLFFRKAYEQVKYGTTQS